MQNVRAGRQQQGVTVGRRIRDDFATDDPIGAAAVVYHDLLFEAFAEFWAHHICYRTGRATRWKRHDDANRSVGIAAGAGATADSERSQQHA
jgi:hypothetical protein